MTQEETDQSPRKGLSWKIKRNNGWCFEIKEQNGQKTKIEMLIEIVELFTRKENSRINKPIYILQFYNKTILDCLPNG